MADTLAFKIGIVGPARVGKTSLIAAMLNNGEVALRGTPVSLSPRDGFTRRRLTEHNTALRNGLRDREFDSGALKGNVSKFQFELALHMGPTGSSVHLDLLDYVGGWLAGGLSKQEAEQWSSVESFLHEATVLLVPVDAAVVMESATTAERTEAERLLQVDDVKRVVEGWAKQRNLHPTEPAMLVFVPVKCETYVTKEARARGRAEKLRDRVLETYGEVLDAARQNMTAASLQVGYCPVDTIGCVRLLSASWALNDGARFNAHFGTVEPNRPAPVGGDEILSAICQQIVASAELAAEAERRRAKDSKDALAVDILNAPFWTKVWRFVTNEDTKLNNEFERRERDLTLKEGQVQSVGEALRALAAAPRIRLEELPS